MQDLRRRWKRRPFDRLFESSAVGDVLRKVAARFWEPGNRRDVQRTSRKTRRASFVLEAIEPRILLSGDPGLLNNGGLTGNLTAQNNAVIVALNHTVTTDAAGDTTGVAGDSGLIIDLTVNGATQTYGDATHGVTSIVLQGNAGDQND